MRSHLHRDEGFTLMELMAVVLIIAILVAIAMLSYASSTNRSRQVTCENNQHVLRSAVSVYAAQFDALPDDIHDLDPLVHDLDSAIKCPNGDGTLLMYDPDTGEISCPNHP